MQKLEKLLRRANQANPSQEPIHVIQSDPVIKEEVLPTPRIIDKDTHPLRFKEGFKQYTDDWNEYASSARLPLQEKVLMASTRLSDLKIEEAHVIEMEIKSESARKFYEHQKLKVQSDDISLRQKKKIIKGLNKKLGNEKHRVDIAKNQEKIEIGKAQKMYSRAELELKQSDEGFATDLDVDRLVLYCLCNLITKQDEIDRLTVMLGRKKSLSLEDLFDLNLQLPLSLSPSDDLDKGLKRIIEVARRQLEMINSEQV